MPRFVRLLPLLIVLPAILACAGPGVATPTLTAPASTASAVTGETALPGTESLAGTLEVRKNSIYVDVFGYFHLVGEIYNGTPDALTGIELMAHVADANGQGPMDADERPIDGELFSPLIYSLAPGESAPFDFFRLLPAGTRTRGWQATATVANQERADLERARVDVAHTRLSANDQGAVFLTGELVNTAAAPVKVSSLAGSVLAADGRLLAANASADFAGWLAPAGDANGGDRTPFVIKMDGPAEVGTQAVYYVDAEPADVPDTRGEVSVQVTNRFADEYDDLHVAANVTNLGPSMLTIRIVVGLYAADGTVLDATSATAPIYALSGTSVPMTFEAFDSLNRSPREQAQLDHVSVQVDPLWTYPIPYPVVMLQTANEVKEPVGVAQYSFRGDVVNNTNADLTSATLILAIFDGANRLIASNWILVYPETEVFSPGQTLPFDMSVYLPLNADVSDYSFTTLVQGYVKE